MAGPLQHLSPGDPLPLDAGTWNAILDSARRTGGDTGGAPLGSGGPSALAVLVRNDTEDDLAWGAVLALGDSILDAEDTPHEARRTPVFAGTAPTSASAPFAVLSEPVQSGSRGRAVVAGVTVCDLVVNDAGHRYAAPSATAGVDALESAASGPVAIVQKYGSSGTVRAVVLIQGGTGASEDSSGGDCPGCGFMTALTAEDCYTLAVDGSSTTRSLTSGLVINEVTYSAAYNPHANPPTLTLTPPTGSAAAIVGRLGCCACPCATFVFPRSRFFPSEEVPVSVCDRLLRVKVCQVCCPIEGYMGPGWYCVRAAGSEANCAAVELLDADACDGSIEICSGPYPSKAVAESVCPPEPEQEVTGSCTCVDVPDISTGVRYTSVVPECGRAWFKVGPGVLGYWFRVEYEPYPVGLIADRAVDCVIRAWGTGGDCFHISGRPPTDDGSYPDCNQDPIDSTGMQYLVISGPAGMAFGFRVSILAGVTP